MAATHNNDRPIRIAIISDGVAPFVIGGIQRHSAMLAEHLARLGARVTLFHTAYDDANYQKAIRLEGFPPDIARCIESVVVDPPRRRWYPGHYIDECAELSNRFLKRLLTSVGTFDYIYAQGLTGMAFMSVRRDRLPPVAINAHGYEMFQPAADLRSWAGNVILRPAIKHVTRKADWVFSFGGNIRRIVEDVIGVPSSRIVEVPNAIDSAWLADRPPAQNTVRKFLFVGRHERRKGIPELLKALTQMPGKGWEFHFVGPMPAQQQLHDARIRYHGLVTDQTEMIRLFDGADVLVAPSYAEGMPTVILEAMARGLAILATDVGANSQLVDDYNGMLLPRATIRLLRTALTLFVEMPSEELRLLQNHSLSRARHFTWDTIAAQTMSAIRSHIANRPSAIP